ncbi:MAG: HEPN domain-containing protein [Defluviitaleaceae bacterium]|nr:HEPN domain-containing protein [Defluviitaleaceae bacterium]
MRTRTKEFLETLTKAEIPPFVDRLILFGSEVYGNPHEDSDIDIAVVSEGTLTSDQQCDLSMLMYSLDPPYDCNLTYVRDTPYTSLLDVKRDIFTKGVDLYVRGLTCMSKEIDYITIAVEDFEEAVNAHSRERWDKTVIWSEQFVEKALKHIIFENGKTAEYALESEEVLDKDKKLLSSHKVHQLGKRVEQILNVSYSEEDFQRFAELERYYFLNENYIVENYISINKQTATELLEWTKLFAPKIQQQIQTQLENLQSSAVATAE